MSNYIVEEDEESYFPQTTREKIKNKAKSPNYIFIGGAILIVIIFIVIISSSTNKLNKYEKLEKEMMEQAQKYVSSNRIEPGKESYILVDEMGIELSNDCSLLSGVFYNEGIYEPYLICKEHKSKIETNNSIDLVGEEILFLKKGNEYNELGYSNQSENINISGTVDYNTKGVYNVYYMSNTSNYMSRRKVVIIDNQKLASSFPIISILNSDNQIEIGQKYEESLSAFDRIDGNISEKIIKINNINENEIGTYKNIYSVTNSYGYTTMVSQNIIVLNSLMEEETSILANIEDENITNKSVKINIKIVGSNYDHIVLPDETESKEKELTYEVSENGEYVFKAVNKDGSEIGKTIKVLNIDKAIPTGTCKALLYSTKTSVSVNVTSFNRVVEYNYIISSNESGYITTSYYNSNIATDQDVYVKLKDYIGNEGKIKCTSEKKYTYDPNGIRDKTYIDVKSRLRQPIADALKARGHTVAELNKCIYDRVQTAGPGTRYGVAAAGYGLIDCMYKMTGYVGSYDHTGGKVENTDTNYCSFNSDICGKLGVNTKWGKKGGSCTKDECWYGLNCATFVGWAMCNGGMDLCTRRSAGAFGMVSTTYFPEADGVSITGNTVKYYSGDKSLVNQSAASLVRKLKPGDAMGSSEGGGHAFLVVGFDSEGIYTAEDGYFSRYIKYSTLTNGQQSYRLLFLDKYYANEKNRNNLYN